jgi:oligopeptide transport system permease protein
VGGSVDSAMMRVLELLYSIPRLIIIIIAVFTFDPLLRSQLEHFGFLGLIGYSKVIILILALGVIEWLTMARIVRGQVLSLKSQQFVTAARSLGQSHARIILRHLFPNLLGIVIVYLTLTIPAVILDESFLSFLGLGINAPQASWGSLLTDGAQAINPIKIYWWLIVFPAAFMSLTLLALNFLGDALRDALDPRGRRS